MARKSSGDKPAKARQSRGPIPKQEPTILSPSLPPRHAAFVDNYLLSYNGTRAAKAAGYAANSAAQMASALLRHHKIAAEISRRRALTSTNLENLSVERIKKEVATVAFSNMRDFAPMFGDGTIAEKMALLTPEQSAAIGEIVVEEFKDGRSDRREVRRTRFKLNSKVSGLELLAKVSGMVTDKVDHTHEHQGLIVHAMLEEIYRRSDGKPIIEVKPEPEDNAA